MGLPVLIELWNTVLFKLIFAEIFVPWKLHKMSLICNPYICIYELHIFILFIFTANVKGFLKHLNILSKIYKHLFFHLCHQINDKFTPLFCAKICVKKSIILYVLLYVFGKQNEMRELKKPTSVSVFFILRLN